ncbi:MAG: histidinol phosphate phosphatase domain-containing protein [Elusimicrobiota bacterium]
MKLIDLHTHTFFSDGVLSPAELVYRCKLMECEAVAITDHVDYSNLEFVLGSIKKAAAKLRKYYEIEVVTGVELTYIPPVDIESMVNEARQNGAEIVVVHGETSAEEVPKGTNLAAVKAKCDILAHPGHLSEREAEIAKSNNVCIELTTRNGHRNTNNEVYIAAKKKGCKIVLNTDTHSPADLIEEYTVKKILHLCNMGIENYAEFRSNSWELVEKARQTRRR